jgi:hypothetical protein
MERKLPKRPNNEAVGINQPSTMYLKVMTTMMSVLDDKEL